jgi:hypothetical protein
MIQKQSNNHHSGRAHYHQEQKRLSRSGVQQRACMLMVFIDMKGIVNYESVPPNTTSAVNYDFYCDVLRHFREICDEKDRNFGTTTTGSFITTKRPPTHP